MLCNLNIELVAESDKGRTVRLGPSDPDSVRLLFPVRLLSDCPTLCPRPTNVRLYHHFFAILTKIKRFLIIFVLLSDFCPTFVRLSSDLFRLFVRLSSDIDKTFLSENVGLSVRHFQ